MKLTWNKILKYLAFGIIAVTVGYFLSNEKKVLHVIMQLLQQVRS